MKFLIGTTLFLIISCSNLGDPSQNDLKSYRGGNAFNTVLDEVLKEDKALASLLENLNDRTSYSEDVISSLAGKTSGEGPENFIDNYYSQMQQQIEMIADSTERAILIDIYKKNELAFVEKMQDKIALNNKLNDLEMQLSQQIQKLKITKTLAYMKTYQESKTFESKELILQLKEVEELLNAAIDLD